LILSYEERSYGLVYPDSRLAEVGDAIMFQCYADDASWRFSEGPLPPATYSFNNKDGDIYSIVVFIHDQSYFGKYICEGEIFGFNMAFYEIATLKKFGRL